MSEPHKPADKAALLASIRVGYDQFEALLDSLSEEEMVISGVNDSWSIKDNIAHLAAWQTYHATRMEAFLDRGEEPPDPAPGLDTEDTINTYFYEKNKGRSLADVLADFRSAYQRVFAATEALSWEDLNGPFPWYNNDIPVGAYTMGNTIEHYEEHGEIIRRWLEARR
ncbi:ClbS/DfsB family four-helix bundle protein [Ktedonospora formicarum]|uniref:ClbS/DfsB family four-helix bundle protein n=1 Tax=Ktedonospora formicarum TaxID=2778364 RepID=A0A8J3MU18_9CHLR|nr:ClbS/DfsB family four-helix bundle protein [Ktedonospora formicarum]GHO46496.1 hypothetical protein KSX_46590 [Ktedonospora formicarum]